MAAYQLFLIGMSLHATQCIWFSLQISFLGIMPQH